MIAPDHAFAFVGQLEELAADVGRLRRRLKPEPESTLTFQLDRIAHSVEALDAFVQPTAAELYRISLADELEPERALSVALEQADSRARSLRSLLGLGVT